MSLAPKKKIIIAIIGGLIVIVIIVSLYLIYLYFIFSRTMIPEGIGVRNIITGRCTKLMPEDINFPWLKYDETCPQPFTIPVIRN